MLLLELYIAHGSHFYSVHFADEPGTPNAFLSKEHQNYMMFKITM